MTTTEVSPFRLAPVFSERVWGRRDLRPWYAETGTVELVGEAWLTGPECLVETGAWAGRTLTSVAAELDGDLLGPGGGSEFPLLVKLLFPNEKLSVQVHPNDAQARKMGYTRGKTECWYVLDAKPGASVALGLKKGTGTEEVRAAVIAGTMEDLLEWIPVEKGDMLFVDAGTVHAIGPGVVLLETQQMSNVTFRMYDYGRPRELHLEQGLAVMKSHTRAGKVPPKPVDGFVRLIEEEYFVVDRFNLNGGEMSLAMAGTGCLVPLTGSGLLVHDEGSIELLAGQATVIPGGAAVKIQAGASLSFVRCMAPVSA